jgi:hypothetical protein
MLYWKQVWKHMHDLTEREIEKRAVMEFICYFEEQMNMVISQSAQELEKKNKFNEIQGIRQMERIDRDWIKNAIKTINNNGHSSVSKRTGGKLKKEIHEKHSQENTEVA